MLSQQGFAQVFFKRLMSHEKCIRMLNAHWQLSKLQSCQRKLIANISTVTVEYWYKGLKKFKIEIRLLILINAWTRSSSSYLVEKERASLLNKAWWILTFDNVFFKMYNDISERKSHSSYSKHNMNQNRAPGKLTSFTILSVKPRPMMKEKQDKQW